MQNITTIAGLKNAIQLLEVEKTNNEKVLKEQFNLTYNSFKPLNLIKGTFKDAVSSPYLIDNVIDIAIGLASGYLTKKILIGTTGNIFKKVFGSILQAGVTKLVAQHPDGIKSIGRFIFRKIFHRKELNPIKI